MKGGCGGGEIEVATGGGLCGRGGLRLTGGRDERRKLAVELADVFDGGSLGFVGNGKLGEKTVWGEMRLVTLV